LRWLRAEAVGIHTDKIFVVVAPGHPAEEVRQRTTDVVSDIHDRKATGMEELL